VEKNHELMKIMKSVKGKALLKETQEQLKVKIIFWI
jgi:hypothetical protein